MLGPTAPAPLLPHVSVTRPARCPRHRVLFRQGLCFSRSARQTPHRGPGGDGLSAPAPPPLLNLPPQCCGHGPAAADVLRSAAIFRGQ